MLRTIAVGTSAGPGEFEPLGNEKPSSSKENEDGLLLTGFDKCSAQ